MNKDDVREGYVTAAEAARILGVSEGTIVGDLRTGRLQGIDRTSARRPRWLASQEAVLALKHGGGRADRRTSAQDRATPGGPDVVRAGGRRSIADLAAAVTELRAALASAATVPIEVLDRATVLEEIVHRRHTIDEARQDIERHQTEIQRCHLTIETEQRSIEQLLLGPNRVPSN